MNKEKAVQKIEYHTTRMFPDRKNAPTQESYIKEMSEGIKELGGDVDEDSEVSSVSDKFLWLFCAKFEEYVFI